MVEHFIFKIFDIALSLLAEKQDRALSILFNSLLQLYVLFYIVLKVISREIIPLSICESIKRLYSSHLRLQYHVQLFSFLWINIIGKCNTFVSLGYLIRKQTD